MTTIGPNRVVSINRSRLSPSSPTRYLTSIAGKIARPSVTYWGTDEPAISNPKKRGSESRKVIVVTIRLIHLTALSFLKNRNRSEERRVGKERRTRWWRDQAKETRITQYVDEN